MPRATKNLASNLNLSLLRTFVRVVEKGNITAAARSLFLTQSAVSMQITALNNLIGFPLLERIQNHWHVTPAGGELYERALEILGTVDRLEQDLADMTLQRRGHVSLSCTRVVGELILAPVILGFSQAHPDIRLDIEVCGCREIETALAHRATEVGLVADPFCCDECASDKIGEDELVALLPAEHPLAEEPAITIDQLLRTPFVFPAESSSVCALLRERLGDRYDDMEVLHFLGSSSAIIASVEAGLACSILPKLTAERGTQWARVVHKPILGVDLRRDLLLAVARGRTSEPVEIFVSWLRETPQLLNTADKGIANSRFRA